MSFGGTILLLTYSSEKLYRVLTGTAFRQRSGVVTGHLRLCLSRQLIRDCALMRHAIQVRDESRNDNAAGMD